MINVTREPNSPASLVTNEIRTYVQECADYKDDPISNPKPSKPTSYRTSDLLEAFDRCFHSKCYLTEEKFFNSWKMDVEHFIPQNQDPALVYEWTNLYPAEHKANMSKPRTNPVGGYLDPCDAADDVENEIIYSITDFGLKPNFNTRDVTNQKSVNTCELLERLHNGHDSESVQNTADLRHGIRKRYSEILEKICDWRAQNLNTQKEVQLRNEIKLLLSRKASFTMLLRSMPAVVQLNDQYPELSFFD